MSPCRADEQADSVLTKAHTIEEVEVSARRLSREVSASAPTQTMGRDMLDAVAAWAAHGVLKQKVQQLIKREMILARLMPLPGVEEDEDNED